MSYKMPAVGDRLLYFANGGDPICATQGVDMLPAIVTEVVASSITLTVFTVNPDALVVQRKTVVHREEVLNKNKKPYKGQSYWVWPDEIY